MANLSELLLVAATVKRLSDDLQWIVSTAQRRNPDAHIIKAAQETAAQLQQALQPITPRVADLKLEINVAQKSAGEGQP